MDIDQPQASSSTTPVIVSMGASKNGRSIGKAHKSDKTAVRRSYISPAIKTPFAKRMEEQKKRDATRATEKEMKEEKEAEAERKRNVIKERRDKKAEKERLEALAAKMSAKKLQRMRKRQGRSKAING